MSLAEILNHYFYAYASGEQRGPSCGPKWYKLEPTNELLERWMIEHGVEEKDADSLTLDARNLYCVEEPLFKLLRDAIRSRSLRFKKHLFI